MRKHSLDGIENPEETLVSEAKMEKFSKLIDTIVPPLF
jgi:hypothetical protein